MAIDEILLGQAGLGFVEASVGNVTRDGVMSDGTSNVFFNSAQKTEFIQQLF